MKNCFKTILIVFSLYNFQLVEANMNSNFIQPVAKKKEYKLEKHGIVRIDNYYWMNKRDSKEVIDYLNSENDYYNQVTASKKDFKDKIYNELKARIKQTDLSVPFKDNGYYYYSKYEEGKEYQIICRKKESLEAPEEVILDCNKLAEGQKYFALGGYSISTNNNIICYGVDIVSRRQYTLYFKDLTTGKVYENSIPNTNGYGVWANDNQTIFYTVQEEQTLRDYRIYRHNIKSGKEADVVVYEEKDPMFTVGVGRTKSRKYIVISANSTLSDEYRIIESSNPIGDFRIFQKREKGLEYSLDHAGETFYVKNNLNAKNFKLSTVQDKDNTSKENWKDYITHRADVFLEDFDVFKDYLVIEERKNARIDIRIIDNSNKKDSYLKFDEEVYTVGISVNRDYDTKLLRFSYNSLTTPSSVYDIDMQNGSKTLLKQQEVLGDYKKGEYISERTFATATDGTLIPISIVRHKDTKVDGNSPLLLYGYGSYGISMDPYFSSDRLSLLHRGFIFAIAHIRGGQENGRDWYENGKFLKKKNTFTDFIDCAKHLVNKKYTNNEKLFAQGGSAGGLLMGAVANMAGTYFKGIISQVPFVDVVTTMLDESIPLTTGEYDEWGNPNDKTYFDYMLSYSPYDNVEKKDYPNMLVMTGYHDSQVQYFEPA